MCTEPTCRVCGCTESIGCPPDSCYWVEEDLCSACAEVLGAVKKRGDFDVAAPKEKKAILRGAELAIHAYRQRLL